MKPERPIRPEPPKPMVLREDKPIKIKKPNGYKLPEVTEDEPYIEFRFDKNGKLSFKRTSDWWGGKNDGFWSSDGSEGNTAEPKDLDAYIEAFKKRKIKAVEKEIAELQKKLASYKTKYGSI